MEYILYVFLQEAVGPDNIKGYGRVDALASYLFSLRDSSLALKNSQAERIVRLWNALLPYDKQRASTPQHPKPQIVEMGRFKARKGSASCTVPGADSTKR